MSKRQSDTTFKPLTGNRFRFRCHKEIRCFTRCCADLNLALTPYDLVRMKRRLGISSSDFLNKHTNTTMDSHPRFPMVKLRMRQDEKRTCPFVTSNGCTIYEDRPAACRIYPLGRAASKPDGWMHTLEKLFIVDEEHCLGFLEDREWTVEEWLSNEGVGEYDAMNEQWLEIITSSKSLGPEKDIPQKIQMFFMACYNLDKFRRFMLESRFLDLFEVESDLKDKLAIDDVQLMKFAFRWLKFCLFGEHTIQMKPEAIPLS